MDIKYDIGAESGQSITIQFYYKGFSVLLTQRDPNVKVGPLLENAIKMIDWGITHDLQPSWNKDTNREHVPASREWLEAPTAAAKPLHTEQGDNLGNCRDCGAPRVLSKTTGKPYCSKKCWLNK